MVATVNGTTPTRPARQPRTVPACDGYPVPCHIDRTTDPAIFSLAASVYLRLNGGKCAVDTVLNAFDALRDANAIVTLYVSDHGAEARVIWPESVSLTTDNQIVIGGYCTLRRQHRSFRLDRMIGCHALTTPDDTLSEGEEEARRVIAEEFDHERWQRENRIAEATAPDGQPF
jgi:predicted DNA-binding transcriptional regulator YafY